MRLAFCLYKYFPHSGLARDMLRIAHQAVERGHMIDVYARQWQGDRPGNMTVTLLNGGGLSNHGRAQRFARRLAETLPRLHYDAVVGFNKMPGLDFYYAADGCFAARARRRYPRAYELTPRYRSLHRLESAVFGAASGTRILLLSEPSRLEYRAFYATPEERLHLLPPTLDRAHRGGPLPPDRRKALRAGLGVGDADTLLLVVGSGFHTKGVDRALEALAALPGDTRCRTRLVVVGRGREGPYRRLAARLNVADNVRFTGGRNDVPALLRAADLLVHPARQENTGAVILEALAAGLPVLATANCGYAHHVRDADAGAVLEAPFKQHDLNRALLQLMSAPDQARLRDNAGRYGRHESLYRMPEEVVDRIEHWRGRTAPPAFHGYVHPDLAELSSRLPRLEDWLQIEGEVFRRTPDRRTVRFEHGGQGYFLKAHFGAGWKETLKNLLQLKMPVLDAGSEWLAIHFLEVLAVPTLTVAAYGRGPGAWRRQSFIVTRELPGMTTLEQYAALGPDPEGAARRPRRRFIRQVAATARAMHGNGINHRDFYLCHFLFDGKGDGPLYLIDLHRAQVRHRTPVRWRVKDLAGLYYSAFGAGLSARERLLFIKSYSGGASLRTALADRAFWKRVERRAHALQRAEARRGHADPAGSAGGPGRTVGPGEGKPRIWSLTSGDDQCPLLADILAQPDTVMARGRTLKHDATTTVTVAREDGRSWVIKRYNTKNRWHACRRLFRKSRAVNCWDAASRLRGAAVDTPRPVAALEERRLGSLRGRSYIVCEFVEGETLDKVLRREDSGPRRERLIEETSRILHRLGDAGIVHGDMKATNFIVSDEGIFLTDLDAAHRASGRRLAAGLQKDLRRFLRNWDDRPDLLRGFREQLEPGRPVQA